MVMANQHEFSFIEKIMIQHAHPAKLSSDLLGVVIGCYFLWENSLLLALLAIFGSSILGTLLVWKKDVRELYATNLGKWMIGQAQPLNLIIRSIGFIFLCLGFWFHSAMYFLIGTVIIIAARFVSNKFHLNTR
jgi:hypothetical protein